MCYISADANSNPGGEVGNDGGQDGGKGKGKGEADWERMERGLKCRSFGWKYGWRMEGERYGMYDTRV